MLDWLHQFSEYLGFILEGIASNLWLSILFIFLVCIGEAVFILGIAVPSLPILVLTGGLIAKGALPFWPIYFAAVAGAVVGDAISYWIGHYFKDRIKTVWPFKNYLPLIARGEEYFHKRGALAIFIGRFITGVKAVIPGVAGMLGMPWGRFSIINVVSAFVWAAAHILPGILLIGWLESIGLSLELVLIVGALLFVVAVVLLHYWKRIILLFAPLMGEFGKSLQARWQKPKTQTPPT
jgi:membrane protein DedA with SNARE-associated domain